MLKLRKRSGMHQAHPQNCVRRAPSTNASAHSHYILSLLLSPATHAAALRQPNPNRVARAPEAQARAQRPHASPSLPLPPAAYMPSRVSRTQAKSPMCRRLAPEPHGRYILSLPLPPAAHAPVARQPNPSRIARASETRARTQRPPSSFPCLSRQQPTRPPCVSRTQAESPARRRPAPGPRAHPHPFLASPASGPRARRASAEPKPSHPRAGGPIPANQYACKCPRKAEISP